MEQGNKIKHQIIRRGGGIGGEELSVILDSEHLWHLGGLKLSKHHQNKTMFLSLHFIVDGEVLMKEIV